MIREAIDAFLSKKLTSDARLTRFRAAVEALKKHPPLDLPDGKAYVEALRTLDVEREKELERLRREK